MAQITDDTRTLLRTCPLCEAVCGLELTLDAQDRVTSVRGDRDDPFSRGFICPTKHELDHSSIHDNTPIHTKTTISDNYTTTQST
ncbi:hypothetical protein ABZW16_31265, partial [Nocardia sp. NPDC004604]